MGMERSEVQMIFEILFFVGIGFIVMHLICDTRLDYCLFWPWVLGLFLSIVCGTMWLYGNVSYAEEYNNFVHTSAYYEELKDESLLNAGAINLKMEQNEWLIDTQYWYTNYPFVSFADEKVMELELIK